LWQPVSRARGKSLKLHNDDIMGLDGDEMGVTSWSWRLHTSRTSGKDMLAVTYYGALSDRPVTEYLTITHGGYAGEKAIRTLMSIAMKGGVQITGNEDIENLADKMTLGAKPTSIKYQKDGKFYRVNKRIWENATAEA